MIEAKLQFILLDYPFGYRYNLIALYINYAVFIDTPLDIAMARRVARDYKGAQGGKILADMHYYLSRGRQAYISSIDAGKAEADLVIGGDEPVQSIVNELVSRLSAIEAG